ncbi:MAG: Gfo/Idh/MocA family oxidoreductase [Ferruginibacter sp.]
MIHQKLRMGMIGGGTGSFIGAVHRIAVNIDGLAELVAGAFSSKSDVSAETGAALFLNNNRVYDSYQQMLEAEATLPEEIRIHFVSIVTPNFAHFEPAMMAMEKGFDVVIEKPVSFTLEQAIALKQKSIATNTTLMLCHTYTGYPMVKQARALVKSGALGTIRKVYVEYPQGWLSTLVEETGNVQAAWRTNPSKSGKAGCMGDIGTHVFNLAEYVSGLTVSAICAQINTVVPGRLLDDDGAALLQFEQGATGVLFATQVATGEENNVRIRLYGDKGGLEWMQADANSLLVKWPNKPTAIYRTGAEYNDAIATHNTRVPAGHPEGYLEAFANLYHNFILTIRAKRNFQQPAEAWLDFPGIDEGIRGMAFIDHVIASGKSDTKWIKFLV